MIFGLTRPGIKPESTVSVADALSTQPLIGNVWYEKCGREMVVLYHLFQPFLASYLDKNKSGTTKNIHRVVFFLVIKIKCFFCQRT